jgi:DNA-binding transcriptional LysR family regulator
MSSDPRHYFKELRLQQFRGLLAVLRTGNFSAAARELKLTKASIWQQVRALEQEFECTLIECVGRKVKPTVNGIRLADLCSPLVEGFDSIKNSFATALETAPAPLSVATSPGCLTYELREAIKDVRNRFPSTHLIFHDRNSPAAIDLVETGEADVAVAARFDDWPPKTALDFLPLTQHPFALAAPPDHPLLKKPNLRLEDLTGFPMLLPGPAANCRPRLERMLRADAPWEKYQIVMECSFPSSLLEYVGAGLGITVTPVPAALLLNQPDGTPKSRPRPVVLRDLSTLLGCEPIFYIRRKGWHESPVAKAFREALF